MSDYTVQIDVKANASQFNKEVTNVNSKLGSTQKAAAGVKGSLNSAFNAKSLKGYLVSLENGEVKVKKFASTVAKDMAKATKATSNVMSGTTGAKTFDTSGIQASMAGIVSSTVGIEQAMSRLKGIGYISLLKEAFRGLGFVAEGTLQIFSDFKAVRPTFKALKNTIAEVRGVIKNGAEETDDWAVALVTLAEKVKALKVLIAPLLALAAAILYVRNAIDVANVAGEVRDEAQKLNISATYYQEFGYVLKQCGVEMTALKQPIKTLNKALVTGDAVLAKYGITATNTEDAFKQAVKLIQDESDSMKKLAMITDLFGNRAAELQPVLNLTNAETQSLMDTYRLLGATMSDELVASGKTYTDTVTELKAALQGLKNTFSSIIPVLTAIVRAITIAVAYLTVFIRAIRGIKETFGVLGKSSGDAGSGSKKIASNLSSGAKSAKEIKKQLAGFDELNILSDSSSSSSGGSSATGLEDVEEFPGESIFSIPPGVVESIENFKRALETCAPVLTSILVPLGLFAGIVFGLNANPILAVAAALFILAGAFTRVSEGDFSAGTWIEMAAGFGVLAGVVSSVLGPAFLLPLAAIGLLITGITMLYTVWQEYQSTGVMTDEMHNRLVVGILLVGAAVTILLGLIFGIPGIIVGIIATVVALVVANSDKIKKFLGDLWTTFSDWFANFATKCSDFINKVAGIIKTGMKAIVNAIIVKIENMWNNIARKFNDSGILGAVNDILGTDIKLPIICIPKLAKGGVLTTPTIAELGEYPGARSNPEIVTPESLLTSIIQANNSDIISALYNLGDRVVTAVDNKDTDVYLDTTRLTRRVTEKQQTLNALHGTSLVKSY